jgi:hypothetical protein
VELWPEWTRHAQRTKSIHLISQCLRFLGTYLKLWSADPPPLLPFSLTSIRLARHISLFPPWWHRTRSSLRSILNKILSFESEEDTAIDPEIPLGQYRSAGLLASVQIESIRFLLHLSSSQFDQFASNLASLGSSSITPTRSNSATSLLTQSEDTSSVNNLLLSEKNPSTLIYFFPLLLTTLKCLTRLLEHKDKHIHSVAFKILPKIIRFRTQIQKHLNSFSPSLSDNDHVQLFDWIHFDRFLTQSLDETVIPSLLETLQLKERPVADPSSIRILVDTLVTLGSHEIQNKIQVAISLLSFPFVLNSDS